MTKYNFDTSKIVEALIAARGSRTNTQFSKDTGVSLAHISRLINGKFNSPPSKEIIAKLAAAAENGVTYKDLMEIAGYYSVEERPESPGISKLHKISETLLMGSLRTIKHPWQFLDPAYTEFREVDLSLQLYGATIKLWDFMIYISSPKVEKLISNSKNRTDKVYRTLGLIACSDIEKDTKFSIVLNDENLFNTYISLRSVDINRTISVILLDLNNFSIVKEQYISYYRGHDNESTRKKLEALKLK